MWKENAGSDHVGFQQDENSFQKQRQDQRPRISSEMADQLRRHFRRFGKRRHRQSRLSEELSAEFNMLLQNRPQLRRRHQRHVRRFRFGKRYSQKLSMHYASLV